MILLIVWDGLRPDMITAERTPYLSEMAVRGTICSASHAAFPTATRINSSSLTTGCYPGRHGIVDNELYVPAIEPAKAISCADWRALQRMAGLEGERLLSVPTLGEMLRDAGRRMVSAGSGSPGTTYLTNPTVTGPIANWALTWPDEAAGQVERKVGSPLSPESSSTERNGYVLRALCEVLVPRYRPDVITLWLTEPDHMQHLHGLASPQALAMLRELDGQLRDLVTFLKGEAGPEGLDCILLSDHGFSTVTERVDPEGELVAAGLKESLDSNDIVRASNSIYLDGPACGRLGEVIEFLRSRLWIGALFLRDDLADECPGVMPQSAVFGNHRRSAEIMFAYRWSDEENAYGVPGSVVYPVPLAATHGSASPYAINNTLLAWGAHIAEGIVSPVPCGIVDVAPTVLHLLGLGPAEGMDGRVLHELLRDGPDPQTMRITHSLCETALYGPRSQVAHYSHVAGHTYLDRISTP